MVTIHEVLKLKKFNTFRLIAGANGLDRVVSKGSFIDHETSEEVNDYIFRDDIVFSTLPMIKDQPEKIVEFVDALIRAKTSCFALKTKLFSEFPNEAIQLANKHNYPLFLFDEAYIDELILDIDGIVNVKKFLQKKVEVIEKIKSNTLAQHKVREKAYELNRNFKEFHVVCMIIPKSDSQPKMDMGSCQKLLDKECSIFPWKEGHLLILTKHTEDISIERVLDLLKLKNLYSVGYSDTMSDLSQLGVSLNQAETALKYGCYKEKEMVAYSDIGVFQIIMPLLDEPVISDYYRRMIHTLEGYDAKYQSGLLETAIAYVHGDGDIKKAADILYQHQNTIRYRVRKIKDLLNLDRLEGMKYESLAIAIHLHELNLNRDKFGLL